MHLHRDMSSEEDERVRIQLPRLATNESECGHIGYERC
jgi:hypothetical protein